MSQDPFDTEERRRRLFLDEWQVGMHGIEENIRRASQGAVDLGRVVLQTAVVLNGGALVLVPGYLVLLDEVVDADLRSRILAVIAVFVAGLILAWLSAAAAYFTMVYQHGGHQQQREAVATRLHNAYRAMAPLQFQELRVLRWREGEETAEARDRESARLWRLAELLRRFAILLNFASFAAFTLGCLIGIAAVL